MNDKKQNDGETTFEWVPPDTTKQLAVDYMKALPVEKLPIKGSIGAVLRRQLLQKQLPLHDIDYKVCDQLGEQERKQFEKYLENIKKYVGQGKVTKVSYGDVFDRTSIVHFINCGFVRCYISYLAILRAFIPLAHFVSYNKDITMIFSDVGCPPIRSFSNDTCQCN